MSVNITNKVKVRTTHTLRTVLTYTLLGAATGSIISTLFLVAMDQFSSHQSKASVNRFYISEEKSICAGDTITLKAYGGDIYEWSPEKELQHPKSATPIASPKKTTTYTVNIYKKQERIIGESGRHLITAELLNSKERIFYRKEIKLSPGRVYALTINARTLSALDKGIMEIIVNRKLAGKYFINNYFRNGFEYIWTHHSADPVTITLILSHYDGDGDIIEMSEFSIRPLIKSTLSTTVVVRNDCQKCKAPEIIAHKNLSNQTVQLTLSESGTNTIRYKKVNDTEWTYLETTKNSITIQGLQEGANYEFEASSNCKTNPQSKSEWSATYHLNAADRIIENVLAEKGRVYKGISLPIMVTPDSSNTALYTYFNIDSPDSFVKIEVWDAGGNCYYSSNIPIENGCINKTLVLKKNLSAGNYLLRVIDGTKSYSNQFIIE
jgi:hypothetical protein